MAALRMDNGSFPVKLDRSVSFLQMNSKNEKNCTPKCDSPNSPPKSVIKKRRKNSNKCSNSVNDTKQKGTESKDLPTAEQINLLSTVDVLASCGKPSPNNFLTSCTSPQNFKNGILEEVLSEKKMLLLQSPEVIQFLKTQQHRKRKKS